MDSSGKAGRSSVPAARTTVSRRGVAYRLFVADAFTLACGFLLPAEIIWFRAVATNAFRYGIPTAWALPIVSALFLIGGALTLVAGLVTWTDANTR